jgi:4-hydroxybenzoate polyprenyltransferase
VIAVISATHFPQALAMVLLVTLSCALLGLTGWPLVLVVIAVASGQASVGWSNDYLDSKVDRELERPTKPVVRDGLAPAALRAPILVSLILVVPFSFLAGGLIGGLAHLLAVASAWTYNLWLARTVWSWLPYIVSFALLPVFIAQTVSSNLWPVWPVTLLCMIVGVTSHLLNAIPDIEVDTRSNLGGLAVRLGKTRSIWLSTILGFAGLGLAGMLIASMS